jgi:RimJ/RimL family protein N-acetyltransferase
VDELLTKRLRLRLWRDEDLPDLRRLDRNPRFMRFLHPQGELRTEEETVARLAWLQRDWLERGFGRWAVEERESGRFVGHAGLAMHRLWPGDPELGYGVDPELWGRGYGTEAAGAALAHGFETLGLERIVSLIHPQNAASIRVAERLGARQVATVDWPEGGVEVLVYAVERPAF